MSNSSEVAEPRLAPDARVKSEDHHLGLEALAKTSDSWSKSLEKKFGNLMPSSLSDSEKSRALTGFGAALYVNNLDSVAIVEKIDAARSVLVEQRGPEFAVKAERMAVLGFAREMKNAAYEHEPLSNVEPAVLREYMSAANYARRELNWSPAQLREAAVDMIVRNDGDHTKAAKSFIDLVGKDIKVEAGMISNVSVDAEIDDSERSRKRIELVAPEHISDRDRQERENIADAMVEKQLLRTDKVAAAVLTDKEYAAYRLIRDNPHVVRGNTVALDGEAVDNTPGKLLSEKLGMNARNGRLLAAKVVEKLQEIREVPFLPSIPGENVGDLVGRLSDYTSKTTHRIYIPTNTLINNAHTGTDISVQNERRDRDREQARIRAAKSYEAKKAAMAAEKIKIHAPNIPSAAVIDASNQRRAKIYRSRDNGIEL